MHVIIRNVHTRETDLADWDGFDGTDDQQVVYTSRYGLDLGVVTGTASESVKRGYKSLVEVVRVATQEDVSTSQTHNGEATRAARVCADQVEALGLDMRVVSAHYLLDRSRLLFFFVSDHRVDFRSLVRDLVSTFHVRVELRQIGVRDETRMVGGMGICGRRLCCNGISDRLAPVSIRMAKDQNYSLNSMKVSGPCGRLLCCLAYEHDHYQAERKRFPREGSFVDIEGDTYRVQEINVISGQVRMFGPDGRYATVPICAFQRVPRPSGARAQEGGRGRSGSVEWTVNPEECPAARTAIDTV